LVCPAVAAAPQLRNSEEITTLPPPVPQFDYLLLLLITHFTSIYSISHKSSLKMPYPTHATGFVIKDNKKWSEFHKEEV